MSIVENNLKPVKITTLLQQNKFGYHIYIKVGTRYLSYSEEVSREELEKLKMRKVESVYLKTEEFANFISNQIVIQVDEEKRNDKISKDVIKSYVEDHALLKSLFTEVGLPEKKVELINKLTKKTQEIIKKTEKLSELFETFNSTHETSIVKKQMEIYLSSEMITYALSVETTSNIDNYVLQMSRAILICDLLLTEEEYWLSLTEPKIALNSKIINHSFDILKHVPTSDFISPPFINLIKYHHEKPDGRGFPAGINFTHFNIFSCIYLIVEDFTSKFISKKMKLNMIPDIVDEINIKYKKFLGPNIEKALSSFNSVMKNDKQYFAEDKDE